MVSGILMISWSGGALVWFERPSEFKPRFDVVYAIVGQTERCINR